MIEGELVGEEAEEAESWPLPPNRLLRPMGCENLVSELKDLIVQLEAARLRIDELAPEFGVEALELQPQLDAYHIYHSNAIEGNSLTTEETEEVVLRGATIASKPLKHSLEARNLGGALRTARQLAEGRTPFNEQALLTLHDLVVHGVPEATPGEYRRKQVQIGGGPVLPPDPFDVPTYLEEFWWWLEYGSSQVHPIVRASVAHWWLMRIHPFVDGNGRVGRLMFYFLLARAGFRMDPVILKEERAVYYDCLAQADVGNLKPICEFVCKATIRSLRVFEEKLAARKRTREALQPSLDQIREELARQQVEAHETWSIGMKAVLQDFRYAANEIEEALAGGLSIKIEDFGVLTADEWKQLIAVGRVGDQWFFQLTINLPIRQVRFVFWFCPHPTFVKDALGISNGVGLSISKREENEWHRLSGPRKPRLRHLLMKDGKHFAQSWVERGEQSKALPIREIELRSIALDFFREVLESEVVIRK